MHLLGVLLLKKRWQFLFTTFLRRKQSLFFYTSGQSYKHFTIVNYGSRVILDLKIPNITTLES